MRSRVLVALAALTLSMLLPAAVGARSAEAAAKAEHDRIVAYWTPARIASAKPRDFVRDASGKIVPYARPGGSSGTGASWTGNGVVEERVGRILFSSGGSNWICSGSVVNDGATNNGQSIILTAGHCAYDGNDGWSYNFMFMPDFDDDPNYTCSQRVLGCWTATRLGVNSDFLPGGFGSNASLRVDYAFARVGVGSKGGQLDAAVGGYDLKVSGVSLADKQWAFGYPAEGKYKGKDLIYCTGSTINDPNGVGTWGMACKMNGGSSGGGWLWGTNDPASPTTPGVLTSVNSYGYTGWSYMFGPRFNDETTTVMADVAAGQGTAGTSVVCFTGAAEPDC